MSGTDGERPTDDAAMADILASIRRIVADGGEAGVTAAATDQDVFELTPAMMVSPGAAPAPRAAAEGPAERMDRFTRLAARDARPQEGGRSPTAAIDEQAVADIVRRVLREEFAGAFGQSLTRQIRALVEKEVARHRAPPDS